MKNKARSPLKFMGDVNTRLINNNSHNGTISDSIEDAVNEIVDVIFHERVRLEEIGVGRGSIKGDYSVKMRKETKVKRLTDEELTELWLETHEVFSADC